MSDDMMIKKYILFLFLSVAIMGTIMTDLKKTLSLGFMSTL